MPRYTTRQHRMIRATHDSHSLWSDGETEGREVNDDGTWSKDQCRMLYSTPWAND